MEKDKRAGKNRENGEEDKSFRISKSTNPRIMIQVMNPVLSQAS